MSSLKCFEGQIVHGDLDRKTFSIRHSFYNHKSLSLENLEKVINDLPKDKILYSEELKSFNVNFDNALNNKVENLSFSQVIEKIKNSSSYIAIKNPEEHESFKEIYSDLYNDISSLLIKNKTGTKPIDPKLWIFIASPNVITPFHFDRYSNFIMQIRGSKQLAVFPPRNEEIIPSNITEAYVDWSGKLPAWVESLDRFATKYDFKPGDAVHIPFLSGHYVVNGSEDISISLSFFFQTEETIKWTKAMKFNNRLRKFGINLKTAGKSQKIDSIKAAMFSFFTTISEVISSIVH